MGMSQEALEHSLDSIESFARLAREDVSQGRLILDLESIGNLTEQLRSMLGEGVGASNVRVLGQSRSTRVKGDELKAQVIEILKASDKPLRVAEIAEEMKKRGHQLPGQGKPANLISHLRRWDEVTRPGYGTYELAEEG